MNKNSIYILIDGYWFNVTEYAKEHPGGSEILRKYHMRDATKAFDDIPGHIDATHKLEIYEVKDRDLIKTLERNKILEQNTKKGSLMNSILSKIGKKTYNRFD